MLHDFRTLSDVDFVTSRYHQSSKVLSFLLGFSEDCYLIKLQRRLPNLDGFFLPRNVKYRMINLKRPQNDHGSGYQKKGNPGFGKTLKILLFESNWIFFEVFTLLFNVIFWMDTRIMILRGCVTHFRPVKTICINWPRYGASLLDWIHAYWIRGDTWPQTFYLRPYWKFGFSGECILKTFQRNFESEF